MVACVEECWESFPLSEIVGLVSDHHTYMPYASRLRHLKHCDSLIVAKMQQRQP